MPRAEEIEQKSFELIKSKLPSRLQIAFWQDATKSDCGVRLNSRDLWLGLQLKATESLSPPTNFNVHGGPYTFPVIVIWLCDLNGAMLLSPSDQQREFRTNTWRVQDCVHRDSYWMTWEEIATALERLLDDDDNLFTELHLRSELGRDDRKEFDHIMLCRKYFSKSHNKWPPAPKLLYDNVCDGKLEQFKTAFHRRNKTVFECPNFAHKVNGVKVPYEIGDVDVFCFCAILREKNVFLVWKVPAEIILPTTKTSITLRVPLHFHRRLFDSVPKLNRVRRCLSPYLQVFELE